MSSKYIFIPKGDNKEKVLLKNILYLEGFGSYTKVFVEDPKKGVIKYIPPANIKSILSQIANHDILRIHRSFAINRNKVEAIKGRQLLIGSAWIPFSESHKDIVALAFPTLKT